MKPFYTRNTYVYINDYTTLEKLRVKLADKLLFGDLCVYNLETVKQSDAYQDQVEIAKSLTYGKQQEVNEARNEISFYQNYLAEKNLGQDFDLWRQQNALRVVK